MDWMRMETGLNAWGFMGTMIRWHDEHVVSKYCVVHALYCWGAPWKGVNKREGSCYKLHYTCKHCEAIAAFYSLRKHSVGPLCNDMIIWTCSTFEVYHNLQLLVSQCECERRRYLCALLIYILVFYIGMCFKVAGICQSNCHKNHTDLPLSFSLTCK